MFVTSLQQPMSRGLARLGDCLKRRAEPVAAGVAVVFARGFASSSGTKASSTSASSSPSPSPPPSGEGEGAAQATADFGFKTVRKEEKEKMVGQVFKRVASKYDVMNDFMSVGIHRVWKDNFVKKLGPSPGTRLLDVAGGTGDISFRFLRAAAAAEQCGSAGDPNISSGADTHVTICDINPHMLEQGQIRAETEPGIDQSACTWVVGSAEELPLADNSVDAYTISFGIRNVTNIDQALREAHRVLVPGGRFMCLEFSHVTNPVMKQVYDTYSFEVIPVLGEVVAGFPTQEKFSSMIADAGFSLVRHENLNFGVAAIHSGYKM
eukprot:gene1482-34507_t